MNARQSFGTAAAPLVVVLRVCHFRDKFEVAELESNLMLLQDVLKLRALGTSLAHNYPPL